MHASAHLRLRTYLTDDSQYLMNLAHITNVKCRQRKADVPEMSAATTFNPTASLAFLVPSGGTQPPVERSMVAGRAVPIEVEEGAVTDLEGDIC